MGATTLRPNGDALTAKDLVTLRDELTQKVMEKARRLTAHVPTGGLDIQPWLDEMRDLIKQVFSCQYMLAKGGKDNMDQPDWERLSSLVSTQYNYFQVLTEQAAAGQPTGPQLAARAGQFANSGKVAFENGKAGLYGLGLPAYPCDGSTECHANCTCTSYIDEKEFHYEATWMLEDTDHCPDCLRQLLPAVPPNLTA